MQVDKIPLDVAERVVHAAYSNSDTIIRTMTAVVLDADEHDTPRARALRNLAEQTTINRVLLITELRRLSGD